MANSIALVSKYLAVLDAVYKASAKTDIFEAPADVYQETKQANAILLSKLALQGLGTYGRNTGHVSGDATLTWETHTLSYDRGRSFQVDAMDNQETFDIAFGRLAGEFIRNYVTPEIDAFRIAKMAGLAGNSATPATLTKSTVDEAIEAGMVVMGEAEVPVVDRVLIVTPTVKSLIRQSDMYVRNLSANATDGVDNRFDMYNGMPVVEVPQTRMYTAITLYDGSTGGQEAGGYIKNVATGKDINFMIVHRPAVLGIKKHVKPRIFSPDVNQSADAWKFDYRIYHDLFVPDNKTDGIYLHNKA